MTGVYFIGPPGSGKSTAARWMLRDWMIGPHQRLAPQHVFGHHLKRNGRDGVYLGELRDQFPGTDALHLAVNPHAVKWLESEDAHRADLILGEGSRLANERFLTALKQRHGLTLIHFTADFDTLRRRTLVRPDTESWTVNGKTRPAGQPQADSYIRSRLLSSHRLASKLNGVTIDTTHMNTDEVEETLCLFL